MKNTKPGTVRPAEPVERELEQLIGAGEAGVEDTIRAYLELERVYLASTEASEPLRFVSGYATTTLST